MPITKLSKNLWRFEFSMFGCCVYLFKHDGKNILFDTGAKWNSLELKKFLIELETPPEKIHILILTHDHFDHVGNISLFQNAKIYASKTDFPTEKFLDVKTLKLTEMKLIETPGHTKGGICLWFPKEKILFSGDTLFHHGVFGRTDFPGGSASEMRESLSKLTKLNFKILCCGHVGD